MAVFRPFLAIFLPTTFFQKTEVQTVIWGVKWVCILIGSKVMTEMQKKTQERKAEK